MDSKAPENEVAPASPEAHEPPAAPIKRSISPAPQDFENPPPVHRMLWPVFWCAIGALLILAISQTYAKSGWPVPASHDAAPAKH